jgi:CheY-like chemotaxis protein
MEDCRILIVDDCLVSLKVLRGKLRQSLLNVKIDSASNGEDALKVYGQFLPIITEPLSQTLICLFGWSSLREIP